ncbi:hypothetical protein BH20ACT5_BH20ACT5_02860 [soil metagenome]
MAVARRAWQRPELRTDEEFDQHRAVGWLELFFDLVFVVVIARLAHHLAGHLDLAGVAAFGVQFLAVFWVWNAFTYYTERFESDGLENRLFAFLAIVPVAGLAVFAEEGLDQTYVGFALAYLLARAVNQAGWARAGVHVPAFRPVAVRFLAGYAVVVAVILVSFSTTGPARVWLFALAVVVDIATPYFTVAQQSGLPRLSTSKFPERFGLFTIIVLGESVVGVIVGLSELQERDLLDGPSLVAGVLGLAIGFSLWWIYFDFVARRAPRPVFVTALFWVYLHIAALTAITAPGVGVSVAIADTAVGSLTDASRYLLVGGVVLGLLGVAALETTLAGGPDEPTHPRLSPGLKIAVAVVVGTLGGLGLGWNTHALLVLLLAGIGVPMTYGAVVWFRQPAPETAPR